MKNDEKTRGQVRGERHGAEKTAKATPQKRTPCKARESAERINGAPVYTAIYKVQRSALLLEFLLRKCNTSRNNVKALLVRRQVLVNGSVVTQYDFPLAKDDEVKLSKRPVKEGGAAVKRTEKRPPRQRLALKIIYEDEEFIAVDKPEGLLSVESDKETECVYGYLLESMQKGRQDVRARPYILHRIDKETSGVLLFAKNAKIHSMLRLRWNEAVSCREYYAVAEGIFEEKSGTVVSYLKENINNLVYSTNDPTGQKAITHYEVVKENAQAGYSLVKVKIDTGRKNQIRVHLKEKGHPIVGEDKYGKKADGTLVKNPLNRLGLHASKLELIHPVTKQILTFTAPVPPAFRTLFER